MATEKQRRTFISYSRVNEEFAVKLATELKSAGYPVWLDQLDIPTGARWDDEIEKALRECGIFLAILTPAFVASENAKDEIGYAIDHGKRILPVLLQDCEVPFRMRRFQYVDFTRMKYGEGVRSAKEMLAKLTREETGPIPSRITERKHSDIEDDNSSRGRERPTRPSKTRSERSMSAHEKAIPDKTPGISKKQLSTRSRAIFAGIAIFVVFTLIAGAGLWRGIFTLTREAPTNTATQIIQPTETSLPTVIADTPTPAAQRVFTEEFDESGPWNENWLLNMKHGNKNNFDLSIANGEVNWELKDEYLWAYYIYGPQTYTDVRMDVEFENLTGPAGSYLSLICGYNENGWYEFNIYGGQYEIIRRGAAREGLNTRPGGLSGFKFGKDVINRVTVICKREELSIFANDENPHPFRLGVDDNLGEGQVGIALSSDKSWPVSVQITSIKISEP